MGFLGITVISLGIAVMVNILFRKIKMPVIIGYIVTGVFIVYAFDLRAVSNSNELSHISEFGIVFLMFMIGLEFSFVKMKSIKQEVITFGTLQVAISTLIFFLICKYLFGFEFATSLVIASALSLSSTAIVLKSFEESREMNTGYGKSSLGILIMQDIAVIPILLMVSILANQDAKVWEMILNTIISAIIVLFILFVPGKFLATNTLRFAANTKLDEIFVGTVLFIVFGAALLGHYFGFSYSLGAFIAGMVISSSKYKFQVEADISHFKDIFLGLFFVTVGMQINIEFLLEHFYLIILILASIMFIKIVVIFGIVRMYRSSKIALKTALAMCQIGEFSFAVLLLSEQNSLISNVHDGIILSTLIKYGIVENTFNVKDMHQFLILMVILSMVLTPFVLKNLKQISAFLLRKSTIEVYSTENEDNCPLELKDHIVVCGYGRFGKEVVQYIKKFSINYIAVDHNLSQVESGIKEGNRVIFGNVSQKTILDKLHLEECSAVVVAVDNTSKIRAICEGILKKAPSCKIIVKVATQNEENELEGLDLHFIINEKKEIAKILGQSAVLIKEKNTI